MLSSLRLHPSRGTTKNTKNESLEFYIQLLNPKKTRTEILVIQILQYHIITLRSKYFKKTKSKPASLRLNLQQNKRVFLNGDIHPRKIFILYFIFVIFVSFGATMDNLCNLKGYFNNFIYDECFFIGFNIFYRYESTLIIILHRVLQDCLH